MCGILGVIGNDFIKSTESQAKALSLLSHRGPDNKNFYLDAHIFLGHTRLSIQDLSGNANQPMSSADGRYFIIFNGEIYNHQEVRSKFSDEFEFKSSGDTETVLYAYIKYGPQFLNCLNGIFALAIYDSLEKELFIARDQMGVKPLYIYRDNQGLLFSSEIKSFLAFNINKELEPTAFANYVSLLWSPGKVTPFKHVQKILPGEYYKFNVEGSNYNHAQPIKYFQIEFNGEYSGKSEEDLINILDEKLLNAVKRQMLSDVPIGFFLSGGLDSSIIVAMAKKLYPDVSFPCFTIDIDSWSNGIENFENDIQYAKKVADYLKVDLNIVKAEIDIVNDFDKMIWYLDEPQADAAPINVLNIASLARDKNIKVLLGGVGGDDLFSGYRRHQALRYESFFQMIPLFVRKSVKSIINKLPVSNAFIRRVKKLITNIDKSTEERMAGYFSWLPNDVTNSLFSEEWKRKLNSFNPLSYLIALNSDIPKENNLLNRMLFWEMRSFLIDHNLNYTDKMAMAVGVEARVPFLDMELIEFSLSIPPELKMRGGETKYLLKKVAERYLPLDVIYRPKTGFGAPLRKWIVDDMDEMIKKRLSVERITKRKIFNPEKVWELIEANKTGKIDASYSIWSLLAIESWITQFVDTDN